MIISMTGFGSAEFENDKLKIIAEVKTLNSKYLDISFKLPRNFPSEKELELRNLLKERLVRGKINASLEIQYKDHDNSITQFNKDLLKAYYYEIKAVAQELEANQSDILRLAMQMPDVMIQELSLQQTPEEEWFWIQDTFGKALSKCDDFRKNEGKTLSRSFVSYVEHIEALLKQVEAQDPKRVESIKDKSQTTIAEIASNEMFDKNRFEQEMIYYIEKLDITEEKVRLKKHLDYFKDTLYLPDTNGKKLGFLSQEISREINTIGAKANDAQIQRWVVDMKDEIEKIKEQLSNIL
jgi:uncharacterized protein (TIGR00255 family)